MARYEATIYRKDGTYVNTRTNDLTSALGWLVGALQESTVRRLQLLHVLHFRMLLYADGLSSFYAEEILNHSLRDALEAGVRNRVGGDLI